MIEEGSIDVLEVLIAHGIDVNTGTDYNTMPLLCAARGQKVKALKALLAAGARVNQSTEWAAAGDGGDTALWYAAAAGLVEAVKALLAAGAEVDQVQYQGYTPLHIAVEATGPREVGSDRPTAFLDTIDLLLQAGANVNARIDKVRIGWLRRFSSGETPLAMAEYLGSHPDVAALLRAHGATQ